MAIIKRDILKASKKIYDLIIIGGGIYGVMLALEASRRNLRSLLIERGDFGEFTSFNSLRIIHGGFRYLQNLDLFRVWESINERRWFLLNFPNLVKPLPCLMPLYGKGIRRQTFLFFALMLYNLLSCKRNKDVRSDRYINSGKILNVEQTKRIFPSVDMRGLQGGAVWYDAFLEDSQRLIIGILRWACEYEATALNYVSAIKLLKNKRFINGVLAIDHKSGKYYEFKSKIVVNASGPWCRELAAYFDRDEPALFKSMMAWNILFNRKAISDYALAVTPNKPDGRTYFLVPWKNKLLAGTGHSPWTKNEKTPTPSDGQIKSFCDDLNLALPDLNISKKEIIHIFSGLQPASKKGGIEFASREVILNHGNNDGPIGLYSISGVKFTTARRVAEKVLNLIFQNREILKMDKNRTFMPPTDAQDGRGIYSLKWSPTSIDSSWENVLCDLIDEESVQHLDDLVIRRTTLWENPDKIWEITPFLCNLFDWDDSRCHKEIKRLRDKLNR